MIGSMLILNTSRLIKFCRIISMFSVRLFTFLFAGQNTKHAWAPLLIWGVLQEEGSRSTWITWLRSQKQMTATITVTNTPTTVQYWQGGLEQLCRV